MMEISFKGEIETFARIALGFMPVTQVVDRSVVVTLPPEPRDGPGVESEVALARAALAEKTKECAGLIEERDRLASELAAARTLAEKRRAQVDQLAADLAQERAATRLSKQQRDAARSDADALAAENQRLAGEVAALRNATEKPAVAPETPPSPGPSGPPLPAGGAREDAPARRPLLIRPAEQPPAGGPLLRVNEPLLTATARDGTALRTAGGPYLRLLAGLADGAWRPVEGFVNRTGFADLAALRRVVKMRAGDLAGLGIAVQFEGDARIRLVEVRQ